MKLSCKFWFLFVAIVMMPLALSAQVITDEEDDEDEEDELEYEYENSTAEALNYLEEVDNIFMRIMRVTSDSMRYAMNDTITELLMREIRLPESFVRSFRVAKYIGKVTSPDDKICVYSWNILLNNGFLFNCIVQTADGEIYKFKQAEYPYLPDTRRSIKAHQWYGALYYDIIPYKYKGENLYLLLGWSRYREDTQYKVIDVLSLDENGVELGVPLFYDKKDSYHRIVLESDRQANVSLVYDPKKKRIVFDHLSPMRVEGNSVVSYGPDMSVDSYVRTRKGWELKEDVNIKNK